MRKPRETPNKHPKGPNVHAAVISLIFSTNCLVSIVLARSTDKEPQKIIFAITAVVLALIALKFGYMGDKKD